MKTNTLCIVLLSGLFIVFHSCTAMMSRFIPSIDNILDNIRSVKLEECFINETVLNVIPHCSSLELHNFYLANSQVLHNPNIHQALLARLQQTDVKALKCLLNNYRTYMKKLRAKIKQVNTANNLDKVSNVLQQAIEVEIAYYDLLFSNAIAHKELLSTATFSYKPSFFSCLSKKAIVGIGIIVAGALAYYAYAIHKKETAPIN